jgi:hypothetical protein
VKGLWYHRHITQERHHLDQHAPDDVNLFDVLERVADITTAGMARSGKIFEDHISPELLLQAYNNTIKLLQENIKVIE